MPIDKITTNYLKRFKETNFKYKLDINCNIININNSFTLLFNELDKIEKQIIYYSLLKSNNYKSIKISSLLNISERKYYLLKKETISKFKGRTTLMLIELYNEIKKQHKDFILIFRQGIFYEIFNTDTYIIHNFTNYKINTCKNYLRLGFPLTQLNTVVNYLIALNISYIIIDDTQKIYEYINNNYKIVLNKCLVNYTLEKRLDNIIDTIKNKKQTFTLTEQLLQEIEDLL
ncbi:MAG: hypothetical protein RSB72_02675 [Bacilli bacterium]